MKQLGLIFAFAFGLLMATTNDGIANEIVVEELGLGAAKKTDSKNTGCGNMTRRTWFGGPVRYFSLVFEDLSLACERKMSASAKNTAKSAFSDKVKLSNFGTEKSFETPYQTFAIIDYDLQYLAQPPRKCFAYGTEIQTTGLIFISGVYCGRKQTEAEFKEHISKIRLDSQKNKSEPPASVISPKTSPTTSTPTKADDANSSVEERLAAIKRLLDKGLISEDEAKAKRQEILSKM